MKFLVLTTLLLFGCAGFEYTPTNPPAPTPSHSYRATLLVWESLGNTHETLPRVNWIEGDCLEGVEHPDLPDCVRGGIYDSISNTAWVLRKETIAKSWLAHELIHAHLDLNEGDARAYHDAPEFDLFPQFREMLASEGL